MLVIGLIINLIIVYNTAVYATAYEGPKPDETTDKGGQTSTIAPVQNPPTQESSQVQGGAYGPNSSTVTPSPYTGPYGQEIGNDPSNGSSNPSTGILGNPDISTSHSPDEIVSEAENFLNQGKNNGVIDGTHLKNASSTLYNILLSIGIFLAVAIGMYLGVKFMMSTAEGKAKVQEALVPYIAGCVVIFAGFAIWRIVILLFRDIA